MLHRPLRSTGEIATLAGVGLVIFSGCVSPSPAPRPRLAPTIEDAASGARSRPSSERLEPARDAAPPLASDASLGELRLYAAENNSGLQALYESWRAQTQRAPQAGALPEPRFTYVEYLESIQTRTGPQDRSFALSQTFPWYGKRKLRASIEEARARAAWAKFLGAELALDRAIKNAYADYYYLGRSVEITRENIELLGRLESVARRRFAAGAANHSDLIRLQVETGRLEDRLKTEIDRRRPLAARLNALLGRRHEAPLDWPRSLPVTESSWDDAEISERLRENNAELLALAYESEGAAFARRLAGKSYFPDLTIGVQTISTGGAIAPGTPDSGDDPWLLSFSVSLPIWTSKIRAEKREAEANERALERRRDDATRRLTASVERALYEHRDAKRRISLYESTLLPKAEESVASTEASFEAGRSDFLDLIDAERLRLEFQLAREAARADALRAHAELERLFGHFELPKPQPTEIER